MSEQTQDERLKALSDRLDAVNARSAKTDARARELFARLRVEAESADEPAKPSVYQPKDTEAVMTIFWRDKYANMFVADYAAVEAALLTVPCVRRMITEFREAVEAAASGGTK